MRNRIRFVLLLLLAIITLPTQASMNIRSGQLNTVNGLADNSVRQIYQDNKGFLWMATLNGLSRYDGNSFVNFYPRGNAGISLVDHRIRSLVEDKNGFLWINTYADVFSCYDLKSNHFVDFSGPESSPLHYRDILIQKDAVWLWGKTDGCIRIAYNDGHFSSETFNTSSKKLPTNNIRFVKEDKTGGVYIATEQGLFFWNKGELKCLCPDKFFMRSVSYKDSHAFFSQNGEIWAYDANKVFRKIGELSSVMYKPVVTDILNIGSECYIFHTTGCHVFDLKNHQIKRAGPALDIPNGVVITDNRDNYWVHNRTGKLHYVNSVSGKTKVFSLMQEGNAGFMRREQYHILHDSRDIIWMTTYGNGLFAYNPQTDQLQHFTADRDRSSYIGSNFLHYIMEDRSGSIWVSSEFSGVSHLSILNEEAIRVFPESVENTSLNTVRMATRIADGSIWLGTRNGGLFQYTPDLTVQKERRHSNVTTCAVFEDAEGEMWVGTRGEGLYVGGRQYEHSQSHPESLSNDIIFSILQDTKKRMWIGTFGSGIEWAIPGKDGYTFRHFLNGEYGQRWIRTLIEDRNGWIWAGTSGGIFVFHPDSLIENSRNYYSYNVSDGHLRSDEIRSIMQDSQGRVWVAESGAGFSICTLGQPYGKLAFTHYDTSDGLVNSKVQAFAEDAQGMIWISTEYGISRFNPEAGTFENYFFSDFMPDNVYSDNCAVILEDGRLAFGTSQGLVVINPENVKKNQNMASITFTDLKLNGISVRPGDEDSPLQMTLAYVQAVQLKHYQNSFAVEFSTLDYSDFDLPKFSYKLENYEEGWSLPATLNFAAYKNLSPGTYYLHVKACNAAGVWGSQEAVLEIVVTPPFWETPWAFLIYTILAIVLLYVVFRTIRNMNSLRNRIMIEKQLTEYKLVFFTNISHEFRTPLTLIQGTLEKIQRIQNMPRDAVKPLHIMDKSTQRMLRLINQLLEFRKMQNNKLALSLEETDVIAFLQEIFLSFDDVSEQKNMTYRFLPSVKSYKMFIDKGKLDKVIYNLLSNAFKYTPARGTVIFSVQVDESRKMLQIQVSDTGVGIPKEKQNELFKRFMQSSFSGDSIGVGLHLSHELVSVHKGTIMYAEQEGGGSIFTVCIPTEKTVYAESDFLVSGNVLLEESDDFIGYLSNPAEGLQEASPTMMPLNKRKVLIIEDDPDIRVLLEEEIGAYFEVETAPDGNSGFEKAQVSDIDLIICDVLMPGMNGFEVTRRLKADFATSHIPIVLLTALSSQEKQMEGFDAGADAYISKPFSFRFLLMRVFRLIEQREKLREKFSREPGIVHEAICSTVRDKEFAERLTIVLEKNMNRSDFSIKDFAQLMKLSQTVFYTKVRGMTGYSPVEYLRIVRLKKAAELLLTADMTVSDVAYGVGFNDPLYFSKCFKIQFGMSPSVFQKEGRKEPQA